MKIYIASSWKNGQLAVDLASVLRGDGHGVDCFCEAKPGRYTFDARELPGHENLNAKTALGRAEFQRAFEQDKLMLDRSDTVVLVLPCGKSAHLEAGYAKGQGKLLYIWGEMPAGDWDVMYGFADGLFEFAELGELIEALHHA